mmetsp:Transcript_48687/g.155586  ORF Transcript_48687/g.155586 Transcript_48687/m.155586 type:complete len:204 (-) Transcript_48687:816-1427(-)
MVPRGLLPQGPGRLPGARRAHAGRGRRRHAHNDVRGAMAPDKVGFGHLKGPCKMSKRPGPRVRRVVGHTSGSGPQCPARVHGGAEHAATTHCALPALGGLATHRHDTAMHLCGRQVPSLQKLPGQRGRHDGVYCAGPSHAHSADGDVRSMQLRSKGFRVLLHKARRQRAGGSNSTPRCGTDQRRGCRGRQDAAGVPSGLHSRR